MVDALVAQVVGANSRAELIAATRALDRVLLWSWLVVPHWHIREVWAAWWDRFGHVDVPIRSGIAFNAWWVDPALAARTDVARRSGL